MSLWVASCRRSTNSWGRRMSPRNCRDALGERGREIVQKLLYSGRWEFPWFFKYRDWCLAFCLRSDNKYASTLARFPIRFSAPPALGPRNPVVVAYHVDRSYYQ